MTFTLPGFSTVKREGVELAGSFTATVDIELRGGSLEETVTVTGESPIVDVQSVQRQQVVTSEVLASIPASRSFEHLAALVPGIQLSTASQNVGGINGPVPPFFSGHGGNQFEGRLRVDGIGTGGATGGVSLLVIDTSNAAEITVSTTGGLADAEIGGPEINVVPRSGGNTFSGQFFVAGANGGMQSDNFTQALRDAGLRAPSELQKAWDVNAGVGGPLMRDRLWFFGTARTQGSHVTLTDTFFNRNAGDPAKWTYEADLSRQSYTDGVWKNSSMRVTWQATARDKVTVFWDEQVEKRHHQRARPRPDVWRPRLPDRSARRQGPALRPDMQHHRTGPLQHHQLETTLTYNGTFGATWLPPNSFMPARFLKVTGQFNFRAAREETEITGTISHRVTHDAARHPKE